MSFAVIGGGITGLVAAYEIAKAGQEVTLYEKEEFLGGLAASFRSNNVLLERFYHHFFNHDAAILELCEELGLKDRVFYSLSTTGCFYNNSIHKLSTVKDLLTFKPLSLQDRVRTGLLYLKAKKIKNFEKLENLTAKDWLVKMAGHKGYDIIWRPLLKGKFGDYADTLSAVWIWNKIRQRGGSRTKHGHEQLAYINGGFQQLIDNLAEGIKKNKGIIKKSNPVQHIHISGKTALWIETNAGREYHENILFTGAPSLFVDIVPKLPEEYKKRLKSIPYLGVVCLVLKTTQKLSEIYWLNVHDPHTPFVGIIEHTNLASPDHYGGKHIIYLSKYMLPSHALWNLEAEELFREYRPRLENMFPKFPLDSVVATYRQAARWAQPVILKNYSHCLPGIQTPMNGLFFCSMAHIYPEDRGINYSVLKGYQAVKLMMERYH